MLKFVKNFYSLLTKRSETIYLEDSFLSKLQKAVNNDEIAELVTHCEEEMDVLKSAFQTIFESPDKIRNDNKQVALDNLIKKGVEINDFRDSDGNTLLHQAVIKGSEDMIYFLVIKECDTEIENNQGKKALDLISPTQHENYEMWKDWVKHPKFFREECLKSKIPYDLDKGKAVNLLLLLEIDPELLKHKNITRSNFNAVDESGNTLAHQAIKSDVHFDLFKTNLYSRVIIDHHKAVQSQRKTDSEGNINADEDNLLIHPFDRVNKKGQTPLHLAVESESFRDHADFLLKRAHNVNAQDNNGIAPIHIAAHLGLIGVLDSFCENKNVEVNIQDKRGETSLHKAVNLIEINAASEAIKILCQNNADANILNNEGLAPLHVAVNLESNHHLGIIEDLCKNGANPNIRNSDRKTPLHMAVSSININTLGKVLCLLGNCDPNSKDEEGLTAFDYMEEKLQKVREGGESSYFEGITYRQYLKQIKDVLLTGEIEMTDEQHQLLEKQGVYIREDVSESSDSRKSKDETRKMNCDEEDAYLISIGKDPFETSRHFPHDYFYGTQVVPSKNPTITSGSKAGYNNENENYL